MITVIPAMDIMDGKCVRLTQGRFDEQTIYAADPLEQARQFEDAGCTRLHLVDLDGAREGTVRNWKVLEKIAAKIRLCIDFGGGVYAKQDVRHVLDSGATWVAVGSITVKEKEEFLSWISYYGAGIFFPGADVKEEKIWVRGWTENTDTGVEDYIREYMEKGIQQFFCTDIAMDGMLKGPSVELYEKLLKNIPGLSLTASGGVSGLADIDRLEAAGCSGVIIGKAIYEGRITLKELEKYHTT